jgi:hypothetical protein
VTRLRSAGVKGLLLCAVALGLAGCGRADDQRAVSDVTETFLRAVAAGDGTRACTQLSGGARQALEDQEDERCATATSKLDGVSPSRVIRAQVFATSAKVDLADGHSAFLELTPNGWRLAAAGCRPEPADAPYTCELSS